MISGGDSAMVSPVVRISRPRSKQSRKTSNARLPGSPARGASSIAADQADVADVDDVRRLAQRVQRLARSSRLHLRGARQQAFLGVDVERRRAPPAQASGCAE